ncbi:lysine 2,3-aminomutase [candidate division KSB1 bacterium]|nr:lysine 2,3-aminomutase [candidate division KSB1 bacterium]
MEALKYRLNSVESYTPNLKYKVFTLKNYRQLPQIQRLSEKQKFEIDVVSNVLPFKVNNYVVDELIDWDNIPDDPIFILTFPQKKMLKKHHYKRVAAALKSDTEKHHLKQIVDDIRWELEPHPGGQLEHNVPILDGERLQGMQHKYNETVLFFPSQGQTCHAYCTFCFRWAQFTGIEELKFSMRDVQMLIKYIRQHPEITDILFTGGDPLVMKANTLAAYIDALLAANISHIKSIRIGTKSLAYWPYRFLTDADAEDILDLFTKIRKAGKHLAIMAHFNHPRELSTEAVQEAIHKIRKTGAVIRTQSPLLKHINADPNVWKELWTKQVSLGCIPYYMFIARNTGAQHYFSVPIIKAWKIFKQAYQDVSGLARTVRGPSMSAEPGKVQILGVSRIKGEKVIGLRFLQSRDANWALWPFYAKYNDKACWLDELRPAFGEDKFFFENGGQQFILN